MSAKARRCHPEEKTLGRYSHDVAGWMSQSVGHARAIAFDTYSTVRWMFCPRPSVPLGCKRNDMTSSPVPQQIQLELIQEFLCFVLFFSFGDDNSDGWAGPDSIPFLFKTNQANLLRPGPFIACESAVANCQKSTTTSVLFGDTGQLTTATL